MSIGNGMSVISCFDIKIDSKHWASGAADIETHHTNHQPQLAHAKPSDRSGQYKPG
ncbi:hypothetical protein [Nostoc sp.]|uniref:hypothetical protein n=1 Tax=Nostoc sp. TaxID=1180 RepID=UPI002FF7E399